MNLKFRKEIGQHIETNQLSYLFIIVLFIVGLIFGAVIVLAMHFTQKQDLLFYVNQYFTRIDEQQILINSDLFKSALFSHFQYLLIIFLLGLSIIGLPIIWVMVFVKGTFIGFTVGYFVQQYGFKGLMFISTTILPQNLIIIPVYLFGATIAMLFSGQLLKKLSGRRMIRFTIEPLIQYLLVFVVLFGFCIVAALIEGYGTSYLIPIVKQFIN
ncbi:stage II sporulation protein M [Amphibacillus xylanus]|uniref:Stage II sporulation protein M n=1 Tax=Amphibacillus xylanus (strain ATCC 51415 / DSM 6626 / JCM 7361 / LMG 17667 / NBRC 15112 / Ep01) TaxID=698758 RepID=K0J3Z4_AMPXN|nr:stage II sporulation protein M [Amphibacillus xylanus]BAM47331.1 stage II sporulation protein M [Amphibacillus xylanus NBRC 15112]